MRTGEDGQPWVRSVPCVDRPLRTSLFPPNDFGRRPQQGFDVRSDMT